MRHFIVKSVLYQFCGECGFSPGLESFIFNFRISLTNFTSILRTVIPKIKTYIVIFMDWNQGFDFDLFKCKIDTSQLNSGSVLNLLQ